MTRIRAVARKEFLHILRDWQTLLIVIAMPVSMMFLYGYALNMDYKELPILVHDPSPSSLSRLIAARTDATTLFKVVGVERELRDPEESFRTLRVKAILRIPAGFDREIKNGGRPGMLQLLVDGSDQNVGSLIRNAAAPLFQDIVLDAMGIDPPEPVTVSVKVLYNPDLKSALFFVPGLMALILLMVSALLTALTLTREKENRTLQQLLLSPLAPHEIVLGKLLPYILLALFDGALILTVGRLFFGIHIQGSMLFLFAASLVYIIASLGIGLLFSTIAKTQQQAMLMVLPATLLPVLILSGFIFPLASMPWPLQWLSKGIPATYFLQIIRGVILKGAGPIELWSQTLMLCCMALFFNGVAIRKFGVKP